MLLSTFNSQQPTLILVLGDANADISAAMQRYPPEGGDSLIAELGWSSGGSAANVATDLALLGGQVKLLARVGADPAAAYALQAARHAGVDLSAIQIDEQLATGLCFAAISASAERTLFSYRGANTALCYPGDALLDDTGWLHIAGHALIEGQQRQTSLQLLEMARQRGIACSLDLCLPLVQTQRQSVLELLPHTQILFANTSEILALAEQERLERGLQSPELALAHMTIIKMGHQGCLLKTSDQVQHIPAVELEVKDTTGCGDAFVAGFLYKIQNAHHLEDCARFAAYCGAAKARHGGATLAATDIAWIRSFHSV